MSDQNISVTYRGKTLTYNEINNDWSCEDFTSRYRGSPSLAQAKARVDKMLDGEGEKPKPFEKFQVWTTAFDDANVWQKVTITGKAEKGELWATHGKTRKKLYSYNVSELKQDTPGNDALIQEIRDLNKQIDALREQIGIKEKSLTPYKP